MSFNTFLSEKSASEKSAPYAPCVWISKSPGTTKPPCASSVSHSQSDAQESLLRRNAVIVLSNSILPVCSPQGSSREAFLIKKRFIILDIHIGRQLSEFLGIIQNNYLFCIICASPIFALRRSRRSACETDLRVSSSIFLSERSIVLTHTNQLSEISRSVFAFVSCITA